MKLKIGMAALLIFFVAAAASAQAFHWHLTFAQAKHGTRVLAIELCEEDSKCVGFAVGACQRVSESRIDCELASFEETAYGELECNTPVHWGVDYTGHVKFRFGSPHCFYIE